MREEYNCFDGSQCIPMEKLCNGVWDCFLLVGTNPCMREEYNCFDGSQCIPMERF